MEITLDEKVKKCPCCDSKNNSFWWDSRKIYFGLDIQYNKCNDCGAYFQVKRIATKRLKDFYTSYYRDNYLYRFEGYSDEQDRLRQLQRFAYMMKALNTIVPNFNPNFCLDIGCDRGIMLKAVKEKYPDCSLWGTEWNEDRRKALQEDRYTVTEELPRNNINPDFVILSHVMEHMNEPQKELKRIRAIMAMGGIMIVEVPNAAAYTGAYVPVHPVAYIQESLVSLMNRAGFRMLGAYTHPGVFLYPIGYYLGVVVQKG